MDARREACRSLERPGTDLNRGVGQITAAIVLVIIAASPALAEPPFQGTAFLSPDIITTADPSELTGVTYTGRGDRSIWDYRLLDWITVNAYLFEARIRGRSIEFQVNPEFGSVNAARAEVDTYAPALGRLPAVLLSRAEKVHVNAGDPEHPDAAQRGRLGGRVTKVFGGNYFDRSFTIHTGYGARILRDGFLEEVLFHEGAHVSLQNHQDAAGWRRAQAADGEYISDYARDFPDREDVAESVLPYFAMRYRPDRLSSGHRAAIADTIPNRLEYFDGLALDWSPYTPPAGVTDREVLEAFYHATGGPRWTNNTNWLSNEPVSTWYGVATDTAGRVTHLRLWSNGLTGRIPTGLTSLASLTHLWLNDNDLTGRIPSDLGGLVNLGHLSLDANRRLEGPVPPSFANLNSLWTLRLAQTALSGPLPQGLTRLRNLSYLDIRESSLCAPANDAFRTWVQSVSYFFGGFCGMFTDDPIVPGETPVRVVHITELRTRIDELRVTRRLNQFPWTDPAIETGATPIWAVHMMELRTALEQAYNAAGQSLAFSSEPPRVGGYIRAAHINELRRAVDALELN